MPQTTDEIRLTREFLENPIKFLSTYPLTARCQGVSSGERYAFYMSPTPHFKTYNCVQLSRYTEKSISPDTALIYGYWLTQGGKPVTIPIHPIGNDFVFTNDLSGCSIVVDQVAGREQYKIYHVNDDNHGANLSVSTNWQKEYFSNPDRGPADRMVSVLNNREYMTDFLEQSENPREYERRWTTTRCAPVLIHRERWQIAAQKYTDESLGYHQQEGRNAVFRLRLSGCVIRDITELPPEVLRSLAGRQWLKRGLGKFD
jgi:hypothetical protein